ncbi:MAG: RdgB/HAM1 family non-canonical purine NTP pyrophosphatase [Acidimicrobiia bacterium]|nr:RdgB/HAM1 family non-canonical purine NTP pyrophosphatase [Acidimicrobiia bacterium]
MKLDRIVVASKNPDKIAEVESVLVVRLPNLEIVRGLEWPDVEETEPTLEGNALLKAHAVVAATGLTALADDTGLEVDALGGAPGVNTARYAGSGASYADNVAKLLRELGDNPNRSARFKTVVAVVDPDGEVVTFEGRLEGSITHAPRGDRGFGYDPVFEVDGRTMSEISLEEKNVMSHRSRAIAGVVAALLGD